MSKAIYYLKLGLLRKQFKMSAKELNWVTLISEYVGIFFKAALSAGGPFNDILFMKIMIGYRDIRPIMAKTTIESMKRYLWYLTPQLAIFALADERIPEREREALAKFVLEIPRPAQFTSGKPQFPVIHEENLSLDLFVGEQSWLIFDILDIDTDWMVNDAGSWPESNGFKKFANYVNNVRVVNDLAERGIKLITDYIDKSKMKCKFSPYCKLLNGTDRPSQTTQSQHLRK
jgi:hypothetical protein